MSPAPPEIAEEVLQSAVDSEIEESAEPEFGLESPWTFSLGNLVGGAQQFQSASESFGTVKDFWTQQDVASKRFAQEALHGHSKHCSMLHLMRLGTTANWESNLQGGQFRITCETTDACKHAWMALMLACIGETFPKSEHICGISVSVHRPTLKLWLTSTDDAVCDEISNHLAQLLHSTVKKRVFVPHYALLAGQTKCKKSSNTVFVHNPYIISGPVAQAGWPVQREGAGMGR
eukprot:NODE_1370_length_988_cov_16.254526_g1055_i0.p1 GENE.NODE_1370_length_988_cov_16.254526_g1055_i0~~NODE_1370_length_988_cov_16.254526_g1055_i0.p1  ORF type:complete len:233 (+),score=34.60 NODE_1370_length_988_cov_16.254526_g1055_i0:105-803(+)